MTTNINHARVLQGTIRPLLAFQCFCCLMLAKGAVCSIKTHVFVSELCRAEHLPICIPDVLGSADCCNQQKQA